MDLLFSEYASPFVLLDEVIGAGEFMNFLDVFDEKHKQNELWEFYIHKLPPWDERTFEQFKDDLQLDDTSTIGKPTDEQLETTVKESYALMMEFDKEGG